MGIRGFMKSKTSEFAEHRKIRNLMADYHSKEDLEKLAKKLHLKTSGNKGDLTKRIVGSPDFNFTVLQRTFTQTKLKKICAELKLETSGTDTVMWNRILIKKGIIDEPELSDAPQVTAAKPDKSQKSPVRRRTATSRTITPTTKGKLTIKTFMNQICSKEDLQEFADGYDLKRSGTKSELIERLTSQPDFELDDVQGAFYQEELQEICRNRDLLVSGTKEVLWARIVEDFNVAESTPKGPTRPTGEKRTLILATTGRQRRPRTITKAQLSTLQEETRQGNATLYEIETHSADEAREIITQGGLWKVPYGNGLIFSNAQSITEINLADVETPTNPPIPAPQEPIISPTPIVEPSESEKTQEAVINAIKEWIPSIRYPKEVGYQAELSNILEHKYHFFIEREAGPSLADILVDGKLPIELKKNPKLTDLDRLSGQVDRHIENYQTCIVVICDPGARDQLLKSQRRIESRYAASDGEVIFIHKS